MNLRSQIDHIINEHSMKAQQSSYDRDTCVLAILSVRETLLSIPAELNDDDYSQMVLERLQALFNRYHDSDGEFTSGRSVIGSVLDDIRATFSK